MMRLLPSRMYEAYPVCLMFSSPQEHDFSRASVYD